jgi:glycogen synthase
VDERMMDPRTKGHNPERLSLLKGGIVYSSAVTTVSPGYAAELMSGGSAGWMKDTLVANKSKVRSSTPIPLSRIAAPEALPHGSWLVWLERGVYLGRKGVDTAANQGRTAP